MKGASTWWNPVSAALLVMVLVVAILGWRIDVSQHNQCVYNNAFSNAWKTLLTQSIHNEQNSTVDSPQTKAARIADIQAVHFPTQVGC